MFKIFVDFDGTITTRDVGEAFMNRYGDPVKIKSILDDWIKDKITSPESWFLMINTFSDFNAVDFDTFIESFEIDSTFQKFVEYCRINNFDVKIVSDGFDIYISKILKKYRLQDLTFYSNQLVINESNKLIPVFPYGDEECKYCGNCKRNHILNNSGDEDFIVYIGDGYSDKCPVQYCDLIFAKRDLLKYCEANRVTYSPFTNFHDVIKKLDEMKSRKRLKKKHQAELKRKEVFSQG